jgi:hypothetical protein
MTNSLTDWDGEPYDPRFRVVERVIGARWVPMNVQQMVLDPDLRALLNTPFCRPGETTNEVNVEMFYVKWLNLPYSQATWEDPVVRLLIFV